jgi:4-hydroxy-3-methylbut-2-enyl diphosphate reductase
MDTEGHQLIPWTQLATDDIVIIPAFGTTLEIEHKLLDMGLDVQKYNTTCPFVEKVWNRADKLGKDNYTVIIHGKPAHEETRATFSHSAQSGPSVIVRNMEEAQQLGNYMLGSKTKAEFYEEFHGKYSTGFDPNVHLKRVGVVNQTTMLATETQAIAEFFRQLMVSKYGLGNIKTHFSDTRDTLCYATNDNQEATYKLLDTDADLAVVVGGYNSSNTSHIVELCEERFATYFINNDSEIKSREEIHHFNFHNKRMVVTHSFLPENEKVKIILTSGASCPDTLVDRVMLKLLGYFKTTKSVEEVVALYD